MAEVIEPPDPVAVVVDYLTTRLADDPDTDRVAVADSLPTARRGHEPAREAVVVLATGGTPRDVIVDDAQITVTSWAGTPGDGARAHAIGRRVHAYMRAAERVGVMGTTPCTSVQAVSLPYDDPDPITGRARVSATYILSLRGRVI